MTDFITKFSFVICLIGAAGFFALGFTAPALFLLAGYLIWDLFRSLRQVKNSPSEWLSGILIENPLRLGIILLMLCLALGRYSAFFWVVVYVGLACIWRLANKSGNVVSALFPAPHSPGESIEISRRVPSLKRPDGMNLEDTPAPPISATPTSSLFMAMAYCGGLVQAGVVWLLQRSLQLKTDIEILDNSIPNYIFVAVLSAPVGYLMARRLSHHFTTSGLISLLVGWPLLQLFGSLILSMALSGFLIAARISYDDVTRISLMIAAIIVLLTGASLMVRFVSANLTNNYMKKINSNALIEAVVFMMLATGAVIVAVAGEKRAPAMLSKISTTFNELGTNVFPVVVAGFGCAALMARIPFPRPIQWWEMIIRPAAFAVTLICILNAGQLMAEFFDSQAHLDGWLFLLIPVYLIKSAPWLLGTVVFGCITFWPYERNKTVSHT
jgi:hypothetical protein